MLGVGESRHADNFVFPVIFIYDFLILWNSVTNWGIGLLWMRTFSFISTICSPPAEGGESSGISASAAAASAAAAAAI